MVLSADFEPVSFFSCHSLFHALQVKKHIKQGQGHEGGIFTVEAPLHVSNVQVIDPVTGFGSILNCYRVLMFCLELEH